MVLIKFALIIGLVFFLLRIKIPLYIVLGITFLFLHILFLTPVKLIVNDILAGLKNIKFYVLYLTVSFIILLGNIMKEQGKINELLEAFKKIFKDIRFLFAFFPAMIGLFPMPGGALFTAPFLEETGKSLSMTNEQKTFFNYWFRHVWEYVWPFYPAFVIMRDILGVSIFRLIKVFYPFTVISILSGLVMLILLVKKTQIESGATITYSDKLKAVIVLVKSIWPLLTIILVISISNIFLKVGFEYKFVIMLFVINILLLFKTEKPVSLLKASFKLQMFFMILFIFLFKNAVTTTKFSVELKDFILKNNFGTLLPIFLIPFTAGLLTGITYAYVAISLPLCKVFFLSNTGTLIFTKVAVFYAAGFIGVMLSPLHLCLALTTEYFSAELRKVYIYILIALTPVLIFAVFKVL